MDAQRKYAYRYLLYHAMLEIRSFQWLAPTGIRSWNPLNWRRQAMRIRQAGEIADWLHNLAFFSATDFQGFDETLFWAEHTRMQERSPGAGFERYRDLFEHHATPQQHAKQ